MQYFDDKVVLVTGAGSGLGLSIVNELLRESQCTIIASGRSEARLKELFGNYEAVKVCCIDLEWDDAKLASCVEHTFKAHGAIDILINCAGLGFRGFVQETSAVVDRKVMQVDYFGQVTIIKAVIASAKRRQRCNLHIIQISSVQGYFGLGERAPYSAAKHALVGFIDSLRAEVDSLESDSPVVVSLVSPGYIATNHSCNALRGDGSIYSQNDDTTADGWSAEHTAKCILRASAGRKREIFLAEKKISFLIIIRYIFPMLCFRLLKNHSKRTKDATWKVILKWLFGL